MILRETPSLSLRLRLAHSDAITHQLSNSDPPCGTFGGFLLGNSWVGHIPVRGDCYAETSCRNLEGDCPKAT